jgi:hypothetical protein
MTGPEQTRGKTPGSVEKRHLNEDLETEEAATYGGLSLPIKPSFVVAEVPSTGEPGSVHKNLLGSPVVFYMYQYRTHV